MEVVLVSSPDVGDFRPRNPESSKKQRAGEGNRTLTTSLEGWDSTIELRPRCAKKSSCRFWSASRFGASRRGKKNFVHPAGEEQWRVRDSNPRRQCQRIYSPPPLAARATLRDLPRPFRGVLFYDCEPFSPRRGSPVEFFSTSPAFVEGSPSDAETFESRSTRQS